MAGKKFVWGYLKNAREICLNSGIAKEKKKKKTALGDISCPEVDKAGEIFLNHRW